MIIEDDEDPGLVNGRPNPFVSRLFLVDPDGVVVRSPGLEASPTYSDKELRELVALLAGATSGSSMRKRLEEPP